MTRMDPGEDRRGVRIDAINISQLASYWEQLTMLATNGVFICITLGLCSLYFVVTGI